MEHKVNSGTVPDGQSQCIDATLLAESDMPTHILIPTDGTELSAKAAAYAIDLAKKLGAKTTAITVTAPAEAILLGEGVLLSNPEAYEENAAANAKATLDAILRIATAAGVPCDGVDCRDDQPWHGIVETAKAKGADLIVIASHGRDAGWPS